MRTLEIPPHGSDVARAAAEFCARQRRAEARREPASHPTWQALRRCGSELWLDSGDLEANGAVWTAEFSGFTTNNTLLNKEVQKGRYDDLVPKAAGALRRAGASLAEDDLVREVAFIVNAVHALTLARTFAADVSVELHTDVVWDADASYEYGRRYHELCPEHFVVKVPLTPEGLLAARKLEQAGVRVNCTLGFSPRQNLLVARVARPHFVNVFLGRINSFFEDNAEAARRLAEEDIDVGGEPGVSAAVASQRMLRSLVRHNLAGEHTRQIAASIRSGSQVAELAGVDVLTMPVAAAEELTASDLDPASIEDRTRQDRGRALDELTSRTQSGLGVFFGDGNEAFLVTEQLIARDPDLLEGSRFRAILADNHLGDLFPELDAGERERIAAGGKIPDHGEWRDRVEERTASWDGLLTEAAIASFAADQAELDGRIRRLLE